MGLTFDEHETRASIAEERMEMHQTLARIAGMVQFDRKLPGAPRPQRETPSSAEILEAIKKMTDKYFDGAWDPKTEL